MNTDLPLEQFATTVEQLTGGHLGFGERQMICPNGVRIRPGRFGRGPRIDIPASANKPHETIHFPPRTPWPW